MRVSAEPTELDQTISAMVEAMGLGEQKRVFSDGYAETRGMNAKTVIDLLTGITSAQRPDHDFMIDMTLTQFTETMKHLSTSVPRVIPAET